MASNRNRRSARNTSTGQNAMGIQKKINRDYAELFKDYKKLSQEIWRIPTTRYFVGGFALTGVMSFLFRTFGKNLQLKTFFTENLKGTGNKKSKRTQHIPSRKRESDVLHA